ncbi:hypothetical protein SAMN04489751_2174 [Brevibacterium sandarakinum]|uniref:Uncharacterized protein n=1 Tax=Brevibacterium sandarakinum TaxID=629680 RepID=A0A1H1SSP2_BRESA|nr:hypothetical protein [Brevibacterium sandarakinum]SDS50756.1 hypothetical protein SAMN04489751_2174 [Brevibacterium sandarakinum]
MIDSPQRSRLSTAILLISASAVLGTVALVFGAAVVVGLTVQLLVFALRLGVPILLPYLLALRICLALLRRFHGNL